MALPATPASSAMPLIFAVEKGFDYCTFPLRLGVGKFWEQKATFILNSNMQKT
jgi:hypothetical protein